MDTLRDIKWNKGPCSMWFPFCSPMISPTFPWYQQVVNSLTTNECKDQRLSTFMCLPLVANQTRLFSIRFNSQNCLWSHNRSTSELEMLTIGSYALSLHVPSCYNQIWPFQICSLLHGYFFHPKKNSTCPSRKACTRVGSRSVTLEATIVSLVALSCWT